MKKKYYLGVDIGGTKSALLAGTAQMDILDLIQFVTGNSRGPDFAINNLLRYASQLTKKFADYTLLAIGISCGGPLDSKKGIIQSPPNLPGWDKLPIIQISRDKFNVPIFFTKRCQCLCPRRIAFRSR